MSNQELLSTIRSSLFDASRNQSDAFAKWRIGSEAIAIDELPFTNIVQTASSKVERISQIPENPSAIIGGLCSIFTGDLNTKEFRSTASKLLRMDQIVEAVGNVRGTPTFVIFEDSFFEKLTNISRTQFQMQAKEAAGRITRWLRLSTGEQPDLRTAYTSDPRIESRLANAVSMMAYDILKKPQFAKIQAAPVLMMYTSYWSDILSSLGIIESKDVICIEPTIHFIDDRTLPDPLIGAYYEFLQWLKDNSYGERGSSNASYGIAGFLESYTGDMSKKRTRLLPYNEVPNTQNVQDWIEMLDRNTKVFPFPLKNSTLFAEAVNWGLWNQSIQQALYMLIVLEKQYYEEKKQMKQTTEFDQLNLRQKAETRKQVYYKETKPLLRFLAEETGSILSYVLGNSL